MVRVSPGSKHKLVATGSHDRTVKVWDANNFNIKFELKGHSRGVWDVAFSPFDRILVSGSGDSSIKLWNLGTGACINTLEGHLNSVMKVIWVNDGL